MCWDKNRSKFADVSVPSAKAFAETNGMELRLVGYGKELASPHWFKLFLINELIDHGYRGHLLYADVGVLFRPDARYEPLFPFSDIMVSQDLAGPCTGLFCANLAFEPVRKAFQMRNDLGPVMRASGYEQSTFKVLYDNFHSVRNIVDLIPTKVVSNPECLEAGSVAHHFWHSKPNVLERMAAFDWSAPIKPL